MGSRVAALVSCYCLVIVAAVIGLGLAVLFLLFILLFSQRMRDLTRAATSPHFVVSQK